MIAPGCGATRPLTHSAALELVAQQRGARDWNTLVARLSTTPSRPRPRDRVSGTYMGHPFAGVLKSIKSMSGAGAVRVSIHMDHPIDVVTFDSFCAHRQRVSATLDPDGVSFGRRSDGVAHLVLDLQHP